jgi:5-methylcytosine-specific restriction enzyme A
VFARDGNRCVIIKKDGRRCWDRDNLECDHIEDRNDHSLENLRTICSWHHQRRSASQGGTASAKRQRPQIKRAPEVHPGLIQSR